MNKLAKLWKNSGGGGNSAPKGVNKHGFNTNSAKSMEYYMLLGGKQCCEHIIEAVRRGEKADQVCKEMLGVYDEQLRIARR